MYLNFLDQWTLTSLDFIAFGSSRGRSRTFMASLMSRFQGSIGDVDFESAASLDSFYDKLRLLTQSRREALEDELEVRIVSS